MTVLDYPYTIGWGITNLCNLQCKHCNMDSGKKLSDELSFKEACKLIDEFASHNVKNICFTGGEPFCRKDFVDICEYAISKQLFVCVTTNGTLLTDEIIQNHLYKFQLVRVSIDAPSASQHDSFRNLTGTFDKAVCSIKKMIAAGCEVGIVTCVSHKNIQQLENIATLIYSLGIKKWFLPLLSPSGRGKQIEEDVLSPEEIKNFILLINELKDKYSLNIGVDIPYAVLLHDKLNSHNKNLAYGNCAAGFTQLMIFPNGVVSPCFAMKMNCGNIRNESLEKIWKENTIFNSFRNKNALKGKCGSCEYLSKCGGGCRAVPFILKNDYLGEDTLCWKK